MSEFRSLNITLDNEAEIRTAEYGGQDHIVVPVVMMVGNSAIRPMGSDGPEFVPAGVLAAAPESWNGSPILPFHPVSTSGTPISANSPEVLDSSAFGQVFGAYFDPDDNKLKAEAWLNPSLADKVGPEALGVMEIMSGISENGSMAELSVGGYVSFEEVSGEANGHHYEIAWADVKPDHLAIFSDGSTGACSNELGCGAPRINQEAVMTEPAAVEVKIEGKFRSLLERFATFLDNEPEEVANDDLTVELVALGPMMTDENGEGYQIEFAVPEGHEIVINESAPEADSCQCQKGEGHTAPTQHSQGVDMDIEQLVGRLVTNASTPYDESDIETLNNYSECKLQALVDAFDETESVTEDVIDAAPVIADEVEEIALTEEEQIEALPHPLKSLVRNAQAQEAAHRERLITALDGAQETISKVALEAKSTKDLVELSALLGQAVQSEVDYSLAQPTVLRDFGSEDSAPAAPSIVARITNSDAN